MWSGYIEAYTFPSGSDGVRIAFDPAETDGPRTGVVMFGDGVPPPPPSNPDVGYPPGWMPSPSLYLWEGFAYPIVRGSVSGQRVQVAINTAQMWDAWCALQTPIPTGSFFGCLPNVGGGAIEEPGGCAYYDASGTPIPVDCGKLHLCSVGPLVCTCDALMCQAGMLDEVSFDFHVDGTNGDGTVTIEGEYPIHLTR